MDGIDPWWTSYDAKLLKHLTDNAKFREWLNNPSPPLTPEELRRMDIRDRWYKRRISRVQRVLEAYHVSAS